MRERVRANGEVIDARWEVDEALSEPVGDEVAS
jgi:hypothetical protein